MQNIGERLEEARKRKGISIREAAEATKVRGDYLHKFESNQFDINLPEIYVRGFLRNYAGYLGLPADKIVNDYNGLGHTTPKPRSLNREIYGRMDLSVASNKESAREPDQESSEPNNPEAETDNPATFKPRPGKMPYVDRALVIKGSILAVGIAVIAVLVILIIQAFSSDETEPVSPLTTSDAAIAEQTVTIHALDSVRIKLVVESTGVELFQGALARGESRSFPWRGSLLLTADHQENIEVEMRGQRYSTQATGHDRVRVPAP